MLPEQFRLNAYLETSKETLRELKELLQSGPSLYNPFLRTKSQMVGRKNSYQTSTKNCKEIPTLLVRNGFVDLQSQKDGKTDQRNDEMIYFD